MRSDFSFKILEVGPYFLWGTSLGRGLPPRVTYIRAKYPQQISTIQGQYGVGPQLEIGRPLGPGAQVPASEGMVTRLSGSSTHHGGVASSQLPVQRGACSSTNHG